MIRHCSSLVSGIITGARGEDAQSECHVGGVIEHDEVGDVVDERLGVSPQLGEELCARTEDVVLGARDGRWQRVGRPILEDSCELLRCSLRLCARCYGADDSQAVERAVLSLVVDARRLSQQVWNASRSQAADSDCLDFRVCQPCQDVASASRSKQRRQVALRARVVDRTNAHVVCDVLAQDLVEFADAVDADANDGVWAQELASLSSRKVVLANMQAALEGERYVKPVVHQERDAVLQTRSA